MKIKNNVKNFIQSNFLHTIAILMAYSMGGGSALGQCTPQQWVRWSMDACGSSYSSYSEFTPTYPSSCASVTASTVYRNSPSTYTHSCVAGYNGSGAAMCVSGTANATFGGSSAYRVLFNVTINTTQQRKVTALKFYAKSPSTFTPLSGTSATNNRLQKYGIRIYKGSTLVYEATTMPLTTSWQLQNIDLSDDPDFVFSSNTTYNVELTGYNPVGSGTPRVWDIDEITFEGCCISSTSVNCSDITAGSIGSNQTICTGGDPAAINSITAATTGQGTGVKYIWLRYVGATAPASTTTAGVTTISGATGASYDPPAGSVTSTTWFRRCSAPNSTSCTTYNGETSWVSVSVATQPAAPIAPGTATNLCPATVVNLTTLQTATTNTTNGTFEWHTTNSSTSALVSNPTAVGAGTYYLFERGNGGCYSVGTPVTISIIGCGNLLVNYSGTCNDGPDSFSPSNVASCITATEVTPTNGSGYSSCSNGIVCFSSTNTDMRFTLTATQSVTINQIDLALIYPINWGTAGGSGNSSSCPMTFNYRVEFYKNGVLQATLNDNISADAINTRSLTLLTPITAVAGNTIQVRIIGLPTSSSCDLFEIKSIRVIGTCGTTVNCSDITAGSIGSNQTICTGGDPAAINSITAATTGQGTGVKYIWLRYVGSTAPASTTTAGVTTISGATGASYDPPAGSVTSKTWFRRCAAPNSTSCTTYNGETGWICVAVNPIPTANITGNTSICTGGSTTLTASGGGTYLWSTGANTAAINVTAAGTYTVTVTNGGCTATASRTVTVTSINSGITAPTTTCSLAPVSVQAQNIDATCTYSWNFGANATPQNAVGSSSSVQYNAAAVGTNQTITLVVSKNGCSATFTKTISVTSCTLPTLTINDITVTEGVNATATLQICASATSTSPITVTYTTSNGTAMSGSDYTTTTNTATIPAGQTCVNVTVPITDDLVNESTENFNVTLSSPSGATIADGTGVVTILDNDNVTTTVATVGDKVWNDLDNDGIQDAGEPGISGVSANLYNSTGGWSGYAQTDANGMYLFNNVAPGTYRICFNVPWGYTNASPKDQGGNDANDSDVNAISNGSVCTDLFTVASGDNITTIDAGLNNGTTPTLPTLTINDITVNENAGTATLQICASATSTSPITVTYTTSNGTAMSGSDYTTTTNTATIPAGQTCVNVSVPIIDDTTGEPTENFNVTLSNPSGATIADGTGVVTILDNDQTTVNCSDITGGSIGSDQTICTGGDPAPFTSNSPATTSFSGGVKYQWFCYVGATPPSNMALATAISGANGLTYDAPAGSVTSKKWFRRCAAVNDPSCTAYYGESAWVCVNVTTCTTPTISINDITVTEGVNATATLQICASATSTSPITVTYTTSNGTAMSGSDYTTTTNTATIPAGQTCVNVTVPITDDLVNESTENFNVTLSSPSGATIADGTGVVTILDNDNVTTTVATVGDKVWNDLDNDGIQDAGEPGISGVSANLYNSTGGWSGYAQTDANGMYLFNNVAPGTYRICFNVPWGYTNASPKDQGGNDANDSDVNAISNGSVCTDLFTVASGDNITTIDAGLNNGTTPTLPTLTINDITVNENAGTATLQICASATSTSPITVTYTTSNGTAMAGSDYTTTTNTATIPAGQTCVNVSVPIIDDTTGEPTENFNVTLSNPSGATIADGTGVVTILDNDSAPTQPTLTINDITVTEGVNATATLQICASSTSTSPITVTYTTSNGTAMSGSDYTTTTNTATIPAGQTCVNVTVPITDDLVNESTENFNVTLSSPSGATIADGTGVVTILDNDNVTTTVATVGDKVWNDLDNDGIQDAGEPGISGVSANLYNSTGGWSGYAQTDANGMYLFNNVAPGTYRICFNVPWGYTNASPKDQGGNDANDSDVNAISNGSVCTDLFTVASGDNITTIDAGLNNGTTPTLPTLTINDITVNENAGTATLQICASATSTSPITVTYTTSNGTAMAGSDYTTTTNTATIPAGQTCVNVSVPIIDDTTGEPTENFSVTLSNPSGATIADNVGVVTINDNDSTTGCTYGTPSTFVRWNMNACVSDYSYNEFTPVYPSSCANVTASTIFRNSPSVYVHSCVTGYSSLAMCVSGSMNATYPVNAPETVRFSITVSPSQSTKLTALKFYAVSPTTGGSVSNNYLQKYAIRILKGTTVVYEASNLALMNTWQAQNIDLSSDPDFTVSTATTFNVELIAYNPIYLTTASMTRAWDLDEISVEGVCCSSVPTCNNITSAGNIGSDESGLSPFNPSVITETAAPSGGSGTLEYKWQQCTDNVTWADIAGATGITYDPSSITVTTKYRRCVRRAGCTTWLNTNIVTKTVTTGGGGGTCSNFTNAGQVGYYQSGNTPFDPAAIVEDTAPTGGSGNIEYIWQSSTDNWTWTTIAGATSISYDPSSLTVSTYFRRGVRRASCTDYLYSNVVMKEVIGGGSGLNCNDVANGGSIGSNQSICSGGDPLPINNIVAATTSQPEGIKYQWFRYTGASAPAAGIPGEIVWGATGESYDPPAWQIYSRTWYRRCAGVNSPTCTNYPGETDWVMVDVTCSGKTGVTTSDINGLNVMPVPANNYLDVMFESETQQTVNVRVFDMTGRHITTQIVLATEGTNVVSFETAQMLPGYYLVEVENGSSKQHAKFVVIH